jgi:hypothetical protein
VVSSAVKVTKEEYYEYVVVYTDDIFVIGLDPNDVPTHLNRYFTLKSLFIPHLITLVQRLVKQFC